MVVAIHQPNFCPWQPFFQKIQEADVFVILNRCQFEKNNFQNRFNYNNQWNTMSVNKGLQPIYMKKYVNHEQDWKKIIEKHPKLSIFSDLINESLSHTNTEIIRRACEILKIRTIIISDYESELRSTDRLVDICKTLRATKYLSGISGKKYLNVNLFEESGIKVVFQDENKMIKKPLLEII